MKPFTNAPPPARATQAGVAATRGAHTQPVPPHAHVGAKKTPAPPPVFRPEPAPKVLQRKPVAAAPQALPPFVQRHAPPTPHTHQAPANRTPNRQAPHAPKHCCAQHTPRAASHARVAPPPIQRRPSTPAATLARTHAAVQPKTTHAGARNHAHARTQVHAHARVQTSAIQPKRPPTAPPVYRPDNSLPVQLKSALPAAPAAARPAPRVSQIIQPTLKVGSDDKFKSRQELKDWKHNGWLYRKIRRDYHNPDEVMRVFYRWANSTRTKYRFDRWRHAIDDAQQEIRDSKKKAKVSYRETTSPMREIEKELYDKVHEQMEETRKKRKRDDWMPTENFLHGHIGELSQQLTLQNSGIEYLDANALSMNMPGIDGVTLGGDKCFSQSKMHLCSYDPETYISHVDRRTEYSKKLVKRIVGKTPSSKKARRGLKEFGEENEHEKLKEIMRLAKESVGESVEDLISYEDNSGLVNMVSKQIYFPVPSDIYSQIPTNQQKHFSPLDYDMRALNKVKAQFDYKPTGERKKKTEDEKDLDFEL